jgi:hypothetical protein
MFVEVSIFSAEEEEETPLFAACLVYSSAMKMKVVHSSEISMNMYQTTWRNIPESSTLYCHRREILISKKQGDRICEWRRIYADV